MTTSVEKAGAPALRPERVRAVAAFFREDPARILAVASSLRAPDRALESTVVGMSMRPTIPPGSRIRIELESPRRYELGEVVAFLAGRHVVVHRIVHRGRRGAARGYLLSRGDAALVPDPPVDEGRILGLVTGIRHESRWMAPDTRPVPSLGGRVVRSLVLMATASLLWVSPRAAEALVGILHRSARPFRGGRRSRPEPQGPAPTGAA